jgi:hypothetical protein
MNIIIDTENLQMTRKQRHTVGQPDTPLERNPTNSRDPCEEWIHRNVLINLVIKPVSVSSCCSLGGLVSTIGLAAIAKWRESHCAVHAAQPTYKC